MSSTAPEYFTTLVTATDFVFAEMKMKIEQSEKFNSIIPKVKRRNFGQAERAKIYHSSYLYAIAGIYASSKLTVAFFS